MTPSVQRLLELTKQSLFDLAGDDHITQSAGVVIDAEFSVPAISDAVDVATPSIETFLLSKSDRSIMALGTNDAVNDAWLPTVAALAERVLRWLDDHGIELAADGYITTSITPADQVNGEAHFDDDQFSPGDGVGVIAIAADIDGPRVLDEPLPYPSIKAPRPVTVDDDLKAAFAADELSKVAFGPHELVVFPQFGQLHAGPGPCGDNTQRRHLLVLRAATIPL